MRTLFVTDRFLAESLQPALEEEGVFVDFAEQPVRADFKVRTEEYDAVLLDRARLEGNGYSRLLRWRSDGLKAHILVLLPGDCDSTDKAETLNAGADAYLLQPLCAEELRAHFRALRRRDESACSPVRRAHDLEINTVSHTVRRGGQPIHLTPREFDLLQLLIYHQGRVVSRATIREHLYDDQDADRSNVVDVYIRYLRNKIDKGFETPLILTRWGQGYLFRAEDG